MIRPLRNEECSMGTTAVGHLSKKCLQRKLALFGFYESTNTPCLWCHKTRLITFTLVVDNFGIKYINKDDVNHLISSIKKFYSLTKYWMGNLYCGIQLNWDYENWTLDLSMSGYIKKKIQEYGHIISKKAQTCTYSPEPKRHGTEAQTPLPPDASAKLD